MNSKLKSLLMITGGVGAGAGAATAVGAHMKHKALKHQIQDFEQYNVQENRAIAQHAFNAGVKFALGQTKTAGIVPVKGILGGLRTAIDVMSKKGITKGYKAMSPLMRQKAIGDTIKVGVGGAGALGAGYLAFGGNDHTNTNNININKESSLKSNLDMIKSAAAMGTVGKAFKDVFYGGLQSAARTMSKSNSIGKGIDALSRTQKVNAVKNALMIGAGGTAVLGGASAIKNQMN